MLPGTWPYDDDVATTDRLVVIRGGGDVATGVVWRLTRAGLSVIVLELAEPLTVRRTVALSTAVSEGEVDIEGMVGRRVASAEEALIVAKTGAVPVMISPTLRPIADEIGLIDVVVDARLAKRPLDTQMRDATTVIGIGPGFVVGEHCHAVVETNRGHRLGRVLLSGSAEPDTGTPGEVAGRGVERVLRAPVDGVVSWISSIGDVVVEGQSLGGVVAESGALLELRAPFAGVVRGLIANGQVVPTGLKICDVDPRSDPSMCREISDKALAVGGGVVEAVFVLALPLAARLRNHPI